MITSKCPGQDTRYWTADDIHEQPCPNCGQDIEFWKTDIRVRCPNCKQKIVNPRFNLGCAQWCAYAEQCLGEAATGKSPQPMRRLLEDELSRRINGLPLQIKEVKAGMKRIEEECRKKEIDPLPLFAAAVVAALKHLKRIDEEKIYLDSLVKDHSFPAEAVEDALTLARFIQSGQTGGMEKAEEILNNSFKLPAV